jgi:hypothetical protein
LDTRTSVAERYDAWVQRGIRQRLTALQTGCRSYYFAASGRNVTQWPWSHLVYLMSLRMLPLFGFRPVRFARQRPNGLELPQ